jgi:hypothetical protein
MSWIRNTGCFFIVSFVAGNKPDLIALARRLAVEGGHFQPWLHHSWGPG